MGTVGTKQVMTLDGTGNVGIGTTAPAVSLDVQGASQTLRVGNGSNAYTSLNGNQLYSTGGPLYLNFSNATSGIVLGTGGNTNNGEVTINWTPSTQQGLNFIAANNTYNGAPIIFFNSSNGIAGDISQSTNAVAFNTTSDRRLKENIAPTTAGLAVLGRIGVADFNFKADAEKTRVQGFIAQDLYTVYPEAVTVGGDDPQKKPWSVDYGRLTPLLVKAVQEVKAELDALTVRLDRAEAHRNGITLFDDTDNAPYCVRIHAGALVPSKGACAEAGSTVH